MLNAYGLAVLELMVVVDEVTIVVAPDPSGAVWETVTTIWTLDEAVVWPPMA
jgi:hypothetical protein